MKFSGFLTDEHIPGPFISSLRSLQYNVIRAKDENEEGILDRCLLEFAEETNLVVITSDMEFTIIDGIPNTHHSGVIFADQELLTRQPRGSAQAVDRIITVVPSAGIVNQEFYLTSWLD